MNRTLWTALAAATSAMMISGFARADGMMVMTEDMWRHMRERSMINEPEQKAVVFFSRGKEQLIISPSYEGRAASFAWVVPVPARPRVQIVKGAIFHELAKLVMPKPPDAKSESLAQGVAAAKPAVTVLERKTVGAYDVSVLKSTDSSALMKWLAANRYHMPDQALGPVKSYVKAGWTFVACRVKAPASANGLHTGTLAPLKLTFATRKPIYPMKLSSANPTAFSVLVYLVLPTSATGGSSDAIPVAGVPGFYRQASTHRSATASGYFWNRRRYPTLAKLGSGEMQIYVEHCYAQPEQCTSDIVWTIKS